ncbi:putative MFS family arabinose efflux permease [Actinopolyspora biskrensis]|uniref:Putative MFS family arabinose efflux permease n=1 Tax=Actinopolyspora biskrensis TaxID=1470178 RepID=A0A852YVV3_9ACTN|nr:putative MFS family arabinose efflux permease [Actinopolyspora biskrensis]
MTARTESFTAVEKGRVTARFASLTTVSLVATAAVQLVPFVSPVIMSSLREELGVSPVAASTLVTAMLLCSAVTPTLFVGRAARPRRYRLAGSGLALACVGFGSAAFAPNFVTVVIATVLAAVCAGATNAAGSAAVAAFDDGERAAGVVSAGANLLAAVLLGVLTFLDSGLLPVFGALAVFNGCCALLTWWLPDAPGTAEDDGARTSVRRGGLASSGLRASGVVLTCCAFLWGVTQDVLLSLSGDIGIGRTGIGGNTFEVVLSVARVASIVGIVLAALAGSRVRRVPALVAVFLVDAAMQLVVFTTGSPLWFAVSLVCWNVAYTVGLIYVFALGASLDVAGRWVVMVTSGWMLGTSLAPVVGRVLAERLGFVALGGFVSACCVAVLIVLCVIARRAARQQAGQAVASREGG